MVAFSKFTELPKQKMATNAVVEFVKKKNLRLRQNSQNTYRIFSIFE